MKFIKKQNDIREVLLSKINIKKRLTKKPIIVGMVGLVGSGKSTVAREIAKYIGGSIVESDRIRVELRKRNQRAISSLIRKVAEYLAVRIIKKGGNVILDSDFVDRSKRAVIRKKARDLNANLIFVRTYCDPDIALGRIFTASYCNSVDDFWGWERVSRWADDRSRGAVVKAREMWRRTPYHYRWVNNQEGGWILRRFPFAIFAEVDTTNPETWKQVIKERFSNL